jgi:hypothetical protein
VYNVFTPFRKKLDQLNLDLNLILMAFWEEKRVLVTGGVGFLGAGINLNFPSSYDLQVFDLLWVRS